jgi:hypothetical protein
MLRRRRVAKQCRVGQCSGMHPELQWRRWLPQTNRAGCRSRSHVDAESRTVRTGLGNAVQATDGALVHESCLRRFVPDGLWRFELARLRQPRAAHHDCLPLTADDRLLRGAGSSDLRQQRTHAANRCARNQQTLVSPERVGARKDYFSASGDLGLPLGTSRRGGGSAPSEPRQRHKCIDRPAGQRHHGARRARGAADRPGAEERCTRPAYQLHVIVVG